MCGITGAFHFKGNGAGDFETVKRMQAAIYSRGPDGHGLWHNKAQTLIVGHRRLAINDLSTQANQPMITSDGRYVMVFNGEIYNQSALRAMLELEGISFKTHCDTEVLLALFAQRGVSCFNELKGMYAVAIWDQKRQQLTLARDPFGIKPLYYAALNARVYFASQVKALKQAPAIPNRLDPAGVVGFYLWGHVPEPYTLYESIKSLPAGCYMTVNAQGTHPPKHFFDLQSFIGAHEKKPALSAEPPEQLYQALEASVIDHMQADVPLGLFLSAGLDSTVLAHFSRHNRHASFQTHTVAFREYENTAFDEAPWAEYVADYFKTRHQTHYLDTDQLDASLYQALDAMDQPSIDGFNGYIVSEMAHEAGLKVALSGLGADEVFGGYDHFRWLPKMTGYLRQLKFAKPLLKLSRPCLKPVMKKRGKPEKYASLLENSTDMAGAYFTRRALNMPWQLKSMLDPAVVDEGLARLQPIDSLRASIKGIHHPKLQLMALEMQWYMRNQLLRDIDWASMAHSLEVRVPFLDLSLLRQVLHLPELLTQSKGQIFKATLPDLPKSLMDRPKTGFFVPINEAMKAKNDPKDQNLGIYSWQHQVAQWYDSEITQATR